MSNEPEISDPRRILALSGGGVRGIIEVAFLEEIEASLKARFGPDVKISDAFQLIGGTSTGALIATALALGLPLATIRDFYLTRAANFFRRRRWWAWGRAAIFDGDELEAEIRQTIGDVKLGDPSFQSHLAIVTKRFDTGSAWIVNNIPSAPFFQDPPDRRYIGHRHYDVAQLLRAATAAPMYFEQIPIEISRGQMATFVDGGLSPYNDPSLALLKLVRLKSFGLEWPIGADNLFVLSIGTGRFRQRVAPEAAESMGPIKLAILSMLGMAGDVDIHTMTMMQWLGKSVLPQTINTEIGDMAEDHLGPEPLFRYLRLDLPLEAQTLLDAGLSIDAEEIRRFHRIDDPEIIQPLYDLTREFIARGPDVGELIFGRNDIE